MDESVIEATEAIVAKETWSSEDYKELLSLLSSGPGVIDKFKSLIGAIEAETPEPRGAVAVKIGITNYMLCRFEKALKVLTDGTDNKDRHYFQAMCLKNLKQYDEAIEEFQRAGERGWDAMEIELEILEVRALMGDLEIAEKALSRLESKAADNPDYLYLRGLVDELNGSGEKACEFYIKAREINPEHPSATFRLAYYYDLHGEEEQAIELYKECVAHPPVNVNVLLNLAVLYEDVGEYDKAASCLRRILICNPNHARAKLFFKDVEASKTMYFDEDQARRIAKRNAVLDIPVTDFELSVRARNCLKKMNIHCLGDLVMITESELLSYQNFGETSLREIKEMLKVKGLRLGQGLEESVGTYQPTSTEEQKAEVESVLATPLERVEFSVRAKNAIKGLNISSLGELAGKTEAELMACKNFGQSSLNEVRQRLAEYGLRLSELD